MALFLINRYQEFNDEKETQDDEANKLRKLKKRIEERKKAKSVNETLKLNEKLVSSYNAEEKIDQDDTLITDDPTQNNFLTDNNLSQKPDIPKTKSTQFKVLGTNDFEKRNKVKRVLPYWLDHPTSLSIDLKKNDHNIQNLEFLDKSLKKMLIQEGVHHLFPVQEQVIPWLLKENRETASFWPRDICVSAPTGSGKTLAYVLPIIQILTDRVDRQVRALVILPVKELAVQVARVFKQYSIGSNLKIALVTGSTSFCQEQTLLTKYSDSKGWQSEVDIIVCTAGRLVEHLQSTKGFSLKHLKFLVMDEADRIMDHIQNDWLHHLNRHVHLENSIMTGALPVVSSKNLTSANRPPQKLFFSATLSQDPEKLNQWNLFQPKLFSAMSDSKSTYKNDIIENIGKYTTPLELTEKYVVCDSETKPLILYNVLKTEQCERVLCFTNSAQSAHRLTVLLGHLLKNEMTVAEISATLSRSARDNVLKKLQNGKVNILISTDALARGIDITNCDLVVSYDPPKNIKTYVHRVGRTGRAGRLGTAVTILIQNQHHPFQEIIKESGKSNISHINFSQDDLNSLSERYKEAVVASREEIQQESYEHIDKIKSLKRGRKSVTFKSKKIKYSK